MNTIEHTETKEHEEAIAKAWDDLGWTDELAQAKSEEAGLNYCNVLVIRSQMYETEQCANEGYYHG